jgi:hypothetical protein
MEGSMRNGFKRSITVLALALLSLGIAGAASAEEGDPIPLCTGSGVAGTVVAVDEDLNLVTIDTGGGTLCNVQLEGEWDHPVTALLGTYFDDADAAALSAALESLSIQIECSTPDGGEETCDLSDSPEAVSARILSVTPDGEGNYIVEVVITTPEGESTKTLLFSGNEEIGDSWIEALAVLQVSWALGVDEEGNPILLETGDQIAAYHEEGWGFGQLVKAYSIASEAAEACAGADLIADMEGVDFCSVTVDGILSQFESGGGWGALFKLYGKPALLGVGHIRNAEKQENSPPANACGYWAKQDEGPALAEGAVDPCAKFKDKEPGKPDWAGSPGGKPKDESTSE